MRNGIKLNDSEKLKKEMKKIRLKSHSNQNRTKFDIRIK